MKLDWISVNEKLPDYNMQVIIWCDGLVVIGTLAAECSQYGQDDHFHDGVTCIDLDNATHWMNIPRGPAPKEGKPIRPERKKRPLNKTFNTSLKKPKKTPNKYNFWV